MTVRGTLRAATDRSAEERRNLIGFPEGALRPSPVSRNDRGRGHSQRAWSEPNGRKLPRENDDEIIYFKAVEAGILDIAVTANSYYKAKETGEGLILPYWEE